MNQPLEFTGERFTPECVREIWYEHFHRYAFAAPLTAGLSVLDAACGEGYGSAHLASSARSVQAVDISEQAITHARECYTMENLEFQVADCCDLPFADHQFDCIVSFETLEHLENQSELVREFRRVLAPGGFLLISSPDKAVYTDQYQNDNEYHVKELYRQELDDLLAEQFPVRRFMNQKLMFHSVIWTDDEPAGVTFQQHRSSGVTENAASAQAAMYFIVLCADREANLPPVKSGNWFFDDNTESVYQHYHHEIRKNMAAGGLLQERDEEIRALKSRLAQQSESVPERASWWRRLFRNS